MVMKLFNLWDGGNGNAKERARYIYQFWWFLSFTLSFFFPERLHCCYIDFHCSYLYSYYNSSRTLCIKCWDSALRSEISYNFLILRIPRKEGLGGEGRPKDRVKTGWIYRYLYYIRRLTLRVSDAVPTCLLWAEFECYWSELCLNLKLIAVGAWLCEKIG